MTRHFLEVAYKGTGYSGFQIQQNAHTVQGEITKAFKILLRKDIILTGSSRTDAGVHAVQNYFHFDYGEPLYTHSVYKLNAILPDDIVIKGLYVMPPSAHCRFDAIERAYEYNIYKTKNPFVRETAFFYPYALDKEAIREAAIIVAEQTNFYAFAKTNTQVTSHTCHMIKSYWEEGAEMLVYNVSGNRFLRGMVRALTAAMLQVGRGKLSTEQFRGLFASRTVKCNVSVPPTGLFLKSVKFPKNYFP